MDPWTPGHEPAGIIGRVTRSVSGMRRRRRLVCAQSSVRASDSPRRASCMAAGGNLLLRPRQCRDHRVTRRDRHQLR